MDEMDRVDRVDRQGTECASSCLIPSDHGTRKPERRVGAHGVLALPRRRWIVIGRFKRGHYVLVSNCGFPWGFLMEWRGVTHVFQQREFVAWEELMGAVRGRLRMAGLRVVESVPSVERESVGKWEELGVLVERDVWAQGFRRWRLWKPAEDGEMAQKGTERTEGAGDE